MPRQSPMDEYKNKMEAIPMGYHKEEAGFGEAWQTSLGLTLSQDTPVLSRLIPSNTESMRTKQLYDYAEEYPELDRIMGNGWSLERGLNLEKAAVYANKRLGLTDVPILEDYQARVNEEYADERTRAQEVFDRTNLAGKAGQFVGIGHASMLDPVYAVGMLTGYGGASTALGAMVRVGAIEMGLEALATPFIADFRGDIGAEYTASEAFINIMAAGVLGGTLSGAGKWFELRSKLKYNDLFKDLTPDQVQNSVANYSLHLKELVEKDPEAGKALQTVIHVLDNYPDQTADAAIVLKADAHKSVWKNEAYRTKPEIKDADLTPEQVFANERERLDTFFERSEDAKVRDELIMEDRIEDLKRELEAPELQAELTKLIDWAKELGDNAAPKIREQIDNIQAILHSPERMAKHGEIMELQRALQKVGEDYRDIPNLKKAVDKMVGEPEAGIKTKVTGQQADVETKKMADTIPEEQRLMEEYETIQEMDTALEEIKELKARDC